MSLPAVQLDAAFLQKCQRLHPAAQTAWGNKFLGRQLQLKLGGGTEVTDHTDYSSGQDYRYVDWNRCARHDELLSRQFHGTERHPIHFLLDCSATIGRGELKWRHAKEIMAALGYLALVNQDMVTVSCFAEQLLESKSGFVGKAGAPRLFQFISSQQTQPSGANLQQAVAEWLGKGLKCGVVVIVSDFLSDLDFEKPLRLLNSQGHEPFLLQLLDQMDQNPDVQGAVKFRDVARGEAVATTLTPADLHAYQRAFQRHQQKLKQYSARYQIGLATLAAEQRWEQSVQEILHSAVRLRRTRGRTRQARV